MKRSSVMFALRSGLTVLGLLALYAVIPVPGHRQDLALTLVLALAGLAGLGWAFINLAVRARSQSSDHREVRVEALVAVLYIFVVFMSLVYLTLSETKGQFTDLHTRIDALYFTVSTIATVGFGDVHATGEVSRAVVTVQIFFDLIFLALTARIIVPGLVSARTRAREEQQAETTGAGPQGGDDVPTAS